MSECEYYYYDGGYCCTIKKADGQNPEIGIDIVHKYCWRYDHDECPIYQARHNSSSSGGCYLTTACIVAKGLPDDCAELQTMRTFRETYVRQQPSGPSDLLHYQESAPRIIRIIENETEDPRSVFEKIYSQLVVPCVDLIRRGELDSAYRLYKQYSLDLEKTYMS